jgi:hypothetical protein
VLLWHSTHLSSDAGDTDAAKAAADTAPVVAPAPAPAGADGGGGSLGGAEDDLLAGFFSDVSTAAASADAGRERAELDQRAARLSDKYSAQDLGSALEQHARLTGGAGESYQWRNLNPFEALQLGTDATVEDIKQR